MLRPYATNATNATGKRYFVQNFIEIVIAGSTLTRGFYFIRAS
jgi:hypothetical protein